jgi:phage I-like protein
MKADEMERTGALNEDLDCLDGPIVEQLDQCVEESLAGQYAAMISQNIANDVDEVIQALTDGKVMTQEVNAPVKRVRKAKYPR